MNKKKTKKDQVEKSQKKAATIVLITIMTVLGILAGMGSGTLQYALATVGCMRAPVAASSFMAGYTYHLPGDDGYGPGVFNEYYCTEQAAKNAGFRASSGSAADKAEDVIRGQQEEEEKRFSPEKINYTVYVPTGNYSPGTLELHDVGSMGVNKQTFFPIRKGKYIVAQAREGKSPNNYEVCTGAEDSCKVIGKDVAGRSIKKQTANKDIITYGMRIGGTFINLHEGSESLSDKEIIAIFNSLKEHKK